MKIQTTSQIINTIKVIALALLLALGISYVSATSHTWTGPTATPPNNNVSAPINTSATAQTKAGALTVGGLRIPTTAGTGKVLTSNDNGTGSWLPPAGGGGGGTFGQPFWVTPTYSGQYKTALCPTGYVLTGVRFFLIPVHVDDERVDAYCIAIGGPTGPTGPIGQQGPAGTPGGSLITCNWVGGVTVHGVGHGCSNDTTTYCTDGKVTHISKVC